MAYARTQKGAIKRVAIKRQLRKLGCTGWKPDDSMKKLKAKLRSCK